MLLEPAPRLLAEGRELCICAQNLIEFWVVATRPTDASGLGWTTDTAAAEIAGPETRFVLLPDTPEIFPIWKTLVQNAATRGKRTHDARNAAVCLAHRAQALLTFNADDFSAFPALRLLDPVQVESVGFPSDPL